MVQHEEGKDVMNEYTDAARGTGYATNSAARSSSNEKGSSLTDSLEFILSQAADIRQTAGILADRVEGSQAEVAGNSPPVAPSLIGQVERLAQLLSAAMYDLGRLQRRL